MKNTKPVVIFDFDGTIVDTFVMAVDIFYKLRPRWPILPKGEVERLRGMAMLQVVQELNIPVWHIPFLMMRGRKIMASQLNRIVIVKGMDEAIRQLHAEGCALYVISSNSKNNVTGFLDQHKLLQYFTDVKGSTGLLGKTITIRKLLKSTHTSPDNAYYIGDETRDIEAAHKAGVHSIAVSWGFNNIKVLHSHHPEKIVFDPDEIIGAIK